MKKINVLIVDDQRLFAESLETVLTMRSNQINVLGLAGNGEEAIGMAKSFNDLDLILMDVRMPVMDGVRATKIIKQEQPHIKIIMLTTFKDDEYVLDAFQYGISGYMLKNTPAETLITSITSVYQGTVQLSPDIALTLARGGSQSSHTPPKSPPWLKFLSLREREVLQYMAKGLDNKSISNRLCIAPQTVKNHVSQIYSKIGTHDRMEAVHLVEKLGCDLRTL